MATARDRRRVNASFLRLHTTRERSMHAAQGRFWQRLSADVLANFRRQGSATPDVDKLFAPGDYAGRFNAAMLVQWNAAAWSGVAFEAAWIEANGGDGEQLARPAIVQEIDIDEPAPPPSIHVEPSDELKAEVSKWLKQRRVGVWNRVGSTTRNRIRKSIEAGIAEGESFDQMEKRLGRALKTHSRYARRRIARTETTSSMNFGQQAERADLGIDSKEWVATKDSRTRGVDPSDLFNHISADGQAVANDQPFVVSGQSLLFPGDGSLGASAGNLIHCRCTAVASF